MEVFIKAKYVQGKMNLRFGHYQNGSVAIRGENLCGEPEFTATVALDEVPPKGYIFLKGWSENEGIPEALVKAGIVQLTGRKIKTGYCEAEEAILLKSSLDVAPGSTNAKRSVQKEQG